MMPYKTTNELLQMKAREAALKFLSNIDESTKQSYLQLSVLIEVALQKLIDIEFTMKNKLKGDIDLKDIVKNYETLGNSNKKTLGRMFEKHIEEHFNKFFLLKKYLKDYSKHLDSLPEHILDNFYRAVKNIDYNAKKLTDEQEKNNQNTYQ